MDTDKENEGDSSEAPRQQVQIVFRKNTAPVTISEHVSLDKFIGESNKEGLNETGEPTASEKHYSIKSIVYHIGARASSGHYTADAIRTPANSEVSKAPNKSVDESADSNTFEAVAKTEWVSFDDSRTSLTSLSDILKSEQRRKTAYMLLYTLEES